MVQPLGAQLKQRGAYVVDGAHLVDVAVHGDAQSVVARQGEGLGELRGRVAALVGVQAHADEHVLVGQGGAQRLHGGFRAEIPQEAQDQVSRHALLAGLLDGAVVAADHCFDRDAPARVRLRVEEALGAHDAVLAGAGQVGGREVVEVVLVAQHLHRRVVHGQEGREVVETVAGAHLVDGGLPDVDPVLLGEAEFEGGFEGAL